MQTALDVHQQSILRKCGPFVKPTSPQAAAPKSKDKASTATMSLAANTEKKRSKGRGRKIHNLSPRTTPHPVSALLTTSTPVPAAQPPVFVTRTPSLNTGRLCSDVSDLLSLGLGLQAPLIGRSTGCFLPALQLRVTFRLSSCEALANVSGRVKGH